MRALERVGRTIGIVDRDTRLIAFFLRQGDVHRSTGAETVIGGGGIVVPETRLENVTTTELEHVQQRILKTESVIVAQESIGGKGSRNSEALVPFFEKEVIGQTNIEAGGSTVKLLPPTPTI